MKLHVASWSDQEPTAQNQQWFSSRRAAEREARANGGSVREVEVPTSRAGLLEFLNKHVWRR